MLCSFEVGEILLIVMLHFLFVKQELLWCHTSHQCLLWMQVHIDDVLLPVAPQIICYPLVLPASASQHLTFIAFSLSNVVKDSVLIEDARHLRATLLLEIVSSMRHRSLGDVLEAAV